MSRAPRPERLWLLAGTGVLALAWAGPLPRLAEGSFLAHMALHMAVVAVAAPLLALGLASRAGAARLPMWAPVAASVVELAAIWAWHAPALHTLARTQTSALVAEQATFLGAALAVWVTALAAPAAGSGRAGAAMAGAGALLFTSMHMTLLGVLIALAPRPICLAPTPGGGAFGLDVLRDQEIGGLLMLGAGGAIYLLGGLALAGRLLRQGEARPC